jgi:calcineurin-like phosphoesterase family protein
MTATIRFIGDVHGKWTQYKKLIKDVPRSIQVGDFGIGFYNPRTETYSRPPHDAMAKGDHKFIRGNHDNPSQCHTHPYWLADGSLIDDKIFCIGGALSIDKHLRTEGWDWWADEELCYSEFLKLIQTYEEAKPRVVVSHECPDTVMSHVLSSKGKYKYDIPSITRQFFDNLMHVHKPDLWIHGHWHLSHHTIYDGVEFIGLGELSYVDLEI